MGRVAGRGNMGQPGTASPADQVMTTADKRMLFLQTAIYKDIIMDPVNFAAGVTTNVKVPQTGIADRVRLFFSLSVSSSASGTNWGTKAPFSFVPQIQY